MRNTERGEGVPGESRVGLAVLCTVMVVCAAVVYRVTHLGSPLVVPGAAIRGAAQPAAVSLILAAALAHLWSSILVLVVMFAAAVGTSAHHAKAGRSAGWLALSLAARVSASCCR